MTIPDELVEIGSAAAMRVALAIDPPELSDQIRAVLSAVLPELARMMLEPTCEQIKQSGWNSPIRQYQSLLAAFFKEKFNLELNK